MVHKLSKQQIKILEFCKDYPRYGMEIKEFITGDMYNANAVQGAIWALAKRGFLYPCNAPDGIKLSKYKELKKKYE